MTKTRYTYLESNKVLADSGEYTFSIDTEDVITRLDVEFKATNGATNNQACNIADVVTSIELMNGSEPIVSVSGKELAGVVAYRNGKFPVGLISETPAAVQSLRMPIDFGRWYGDEQLALDTSKMNKLQFRIKWNLAEVNAVGATGFVTATARLTVLAHILEGGQAPIGYLSLKRHALFTTAASGVEPILLPVDKPIRSISIRSHEAGTGMLSGISHVKVNVNENKDIPLDLDVDEFLESVVNPVYPFSYKHVFHLTNADVAYALLKYKEALVTRTEVIDTDALYVNTGIGEGAIVKFTPSTGAALATDGIIDAFVSGYLPFSVAYAQFGSYDDPNSWLRAELLKSLKLELTQDNAGASTSVILEQLNNF